jgi:hypothetical protein
VIAGVGQLAFVLGLLDLEARVCAGLDLGLGRGDDGQAHQFLDLALELFLQALGVLEAQRLVLARVGFDLGPVQTDGAEPEQPHRLRDEQ